jgi:hypothetical protein
VTPPTKTLLAYELDAQDDDSYMLGDDTYVPPGDRYLFHDWRFGKNGVPHPATCGTCGRKTSGDFIDPSLRVRKRRRDATATYDGYLLVSQRLVDIGLTNGLNVDDVVALPGDRSFYWLRPKRILGFGATTSKPCSACRGFYSVIRPEPLYCKDLREPLAPGFYRSDLEFGSGPEQGPVIVLGAHTGEALRGAKLSGSELTPIFAERAV